MERFGWLYPVPKKYVRWAESIPMTQTHIYIMEFTLASNARMARSHRL